MINREMKGEDGVGKSEEEISLTSKESRFINQNIPSLSLHPSLVPSLPKAETMNEI